MIKRQWGVETMGVVIDSPVHMKRAIQLLSKSLARSPYRFGCKSANLFRTEPSFDYVAYLNVLSVCRDDIGMLTAPPSTSWPFSPPPLHSAL